MLGGYELTQMLHAFVALGVPDMLVGGPRDVEAMADELEVDASYLHRLLRALASQGILIRDPDDRFGLSPTGRRLTSDAAGSLRPHALADGAEWWWGSWGRLLDSIRTGRPAFELANGGSAYDYMAERPEMARVFSDYMYAMTSEEADAIAEAYDFSTTRLLVDVGGGQGALAHAVLKASPTTRAIVVDTPSVAESANARFAESGLGDRAEAVPGDILHSVPTGGDLYVLRNVIHDWPDDVALAILGACRNAMTPTPDARLLLAGYPVDGSTTRGPMIDLALLVSRGGGSDRSMNTGTCWKRPDSPCSRSSKRAPDRRCSLVVQQPRASCLTSRCP